MACRESNSGIRLWCRWIGKKTIYYTAFLLILGFLMSGMTVTAESNVMVLEAENPDFVKLTGEWQTISEKGVTSIMTSKEGSVFAVEFFGTEFSIKAYSNRGSVLNLKVDGINKGTVALGKTPYSQIKLVEGLDNTDHTIEVTLSSGTIHIDKFIVGSPTEIPAFGSKYPDDYYTRAIFNRPWIFQDNGGVYWISMEVQSLSQYGDIYIARSEDGVSWSVPKPVVTGIYHEYDSSVAVDDKGEFWMTFTRMEPPENKSALKTVSGTVNTPYYTHSTDGIRWDEPQRIHIPQDNSYYPYLYYDIDVGVFIYLYTSSSVEGGEFHDNISIAVSGSMEDIGEQPLQITDNSMNSSYYPTIIKDEGGEYWVYFVSPKFEDEEVFANHNDIFVMHSTDLKQWSAPSLVTDANITVAYNYLHPAYSNGVYYLAIMSSKVLTEDAYIMRSNNGITFTPPQRMIDHDDGKIIDYKSMFVDDRAVLWMAYSHVMDDGTRAIFVVNSSDGIAWNKPIRVSPESNIYGVLWLASEPVPESVRKLEESGPKDLNFPDDSMTEQSGAQSKDIPGAGYRFAWLAAVLVFLLVANYMKKRRSLDEI